MKKVLFLAVLTLATTLQAGSKFTEWSAPVNLGPGVNSSYVDFAPAISKNGLSLYFSSDRPDQNLGGTDLYVSQRSSTTEPWGPPVNLGPTINSSKSDEGPALSRDG